jgi:hypothetical protein
MRAHQRFDSRALVRKELKVEGQAVLGKQVKILPECRVEQWIVGRDCVKPSVKRLTYPTDIGEGAMRLQQGFCVRRGKISVCDNCLRYTTRRRTIRDALQPTSLTKVIARIVFCLDMHRRNYLETGGIVEKIGYKVVAAQR